MLAKWMARRSVLNLKLCREDEGEKDECQRSERGKSGKGRAEKIRTRQEGKKESDTHMKQTCLGASALGIEGGAAFEGRRFLREFRFEGVVGVFRPRTGGAT